MITFLGRVCGVVLLPGSGERCLYSACCCCCCRDLASIKVQPDTGGLCICCLFLPSPTHVLWAGGEGRGGEGWAALQPVLGTDSSTRTHALTRTHARTHTHKYTTPLQHTLTVICPSSPFPALPTRRGAAGFQGRAFVWSLGSGWVVPYNVMKLCIAF